MPELDEHQERVTREIIDEELFRFQKAYNLTDKEVSEGRMKLLAGHGLADPAAAPEAPAQAEPYSLSSGRPPSLLEAEALSREQLAIVDQRYGKGWENAAAQDVAWEAASERQAAHLETKKAEANHIELYNTDANYRDQVDRARKASELVNRQMTLSDRELLDLAGSAGQQAVSDVKEQLDPYTLTGSPIWSRG